MNSNNPIDLLSKYADPKKVFFAIAILVLAHKIRGYIHKHTIATKFKKLAAEKRKQRDDQIATEHISPDDVPEEIRTLIRFSTVTELSQLLNEDKITSEQILKTYHSRAIIVGLSLELIGDSNYKEALELAKKCDEIRKNTRPEDRHTLGGLFGIPISIKDSFVQKGLDSTLGSTPLCFSPSPKDGEIIAFLKSRGAIPFIRTTVPQALSSIECVNHIWGRGLNPWNQERIIGGSSGGEAGLVAVRCSPIGLGSDAMGSIRIPSAFNGVIGFRPTTGRYITKGHSKGGPYLNAKYSSINLCNGPITRTVEDAVLFTKELISEEGRKIDPQYPYVAWSEEKYLSTKKMRIAYTVTEDFFGASKASQRAVRETVENLRKLGHEMIEIKIPNFERIALLMLMVNSSEGKGRQLEKELGGEDPVKELKGQILASTLPTFLKKTAKSILRLLGHKRLASILEMHVEMTVAEFHEKMNEYYQRKEELLQFFVENRYDAIISPAMPLPAYKHGVVVELAIGACYNWPATMANLPAGIVPVTVVKEGEDVYTRDECIHNDKIFQCCQKDIKGSVGLPMGVQVMTLPWEDEKCLAIMKAIETEAGFIMLRAKDCFDFN